MAAKDEWRFPSPCCMYSEMEGTRHYSRNAGLHLKRTIEAITPTVLQALAQTPISSNEPFVICDYGCADGGMSVSLMKKIIEFIKKKYGTDQQIHIVYEDQPWNDFKSVFLGVNGLLDPNEALVSTNQNVFVTACGTSFFNQCLPDNSVHLAFSSSAFHFLSSRPCNIPDAMHPSLTKDKSARAKFQEQGKKDWETLLLHRAKELVPGGSIIASFGTKSTDQKQYLWYNLFRLMHDIMKDMQKEGLITEDEMKAPVACGWERTKDEIIAPFQDENSPVYKAGLRLVSQRMVVLPCPQLQEWKQQIDPDSYESRQKHAKKFVASVKVWFHGTIYQAWSLRHPDDKRDSLTTEFFHQLEQKIRDDPSQYGYEVLQSFIHIQKE